MCGVPALFPCELSLLIECVDGIARCNLTVNIPTSAALVNRFSLYLKK